MTWKSVLLIAAALIAAPGLVVCVIYALTGVIFVP